MQIRPARVTETASLDSIARAAKAHWGYSEAQLALWAHELVTSPESVRRWPTRVAERDGEILGFAQADTDREHWDLVGLWVHPAAMGGGVGKALLLDVLGLAAAAGVPALTIDSDPNAAGFYEACGARLQGQISAPVAHDPQRVRPQYLLATLTPGPRTSQPGR